MNENKVLLTQKEIDALVDFLTTKEKVGNEVLDQASIDRLIKVLTDSRLMERAGAEVSAEYFFANSVLSIEKDIAVQRKQCTLLYEKDAEGYAHVLCVNRVTGMKYEITPECLNQLNLVESKGEGWGRAVMPFLFDLAAMQLQIKYTAETFAAVCGDFATLMYGDAGIQLPNVYLPSAARLLENIKKET